MNTGRAMTRASSVRSVLRQWHVLCLSWLVCSALAVSSSLADFPASAPEPSSQILSLEAAVALALERNPELAAIRQQHGVAAAGVTIARTYPYNPITESTMSYVTGPQAAGITNVVPNHHKITLDVETRGQRSFRKQAAFAALSRTDWEIAFQEVTFAVNAIRAYDNLLYRSRKLSVTEEFLRLNQQGAEQVKELVERGTLRPADLILARAEVRDIQTQLGLNRTALVSARRDFYRALGVTEGNFILQGVLERTAPSAQAQGLLEAAMDHRPDLFARRAAVAEADSRVRLQVADRLGNPNVGPVYEYNEARSNFIGVQVGVPIPVFNRRQGEIQQLQAQHAQAMLYLQQTEVDIRRDVPVSVARLAEARDWVQNYQKEVLPDLKKSLDDINGLFKEGQPGVDVLRVLEVRRKLLHAQDGYLDALLTHTQALADLALAVGDPALAMDLYQEPEALPKRNGP